MAMKLKKREEDVEENLRYSVLRLSKICRTQFLRILLVRIIYKNVIRIGYFFMEDEVLRILSNRKSYTHAINALKNHT